MIQIEVITTGEELLDGRVLNSNLVFLGQHCHTLGLTIQRHITIGDCAQVLTNLFKERAPHAHWILITGGLGPTDDDRTTACIADAFRLPLIRDSASVEAIEAYYQAKKAKNPKSNLKQADFPKGAIVLENPLGTAPGFLLEIEHTKIVVMPGVPSEMKRMFLTHIYPRLESESRALPIKTVCATLKCAGVGESALADALADLYPLPDGVELGYRAQVTEVALQLLVQRSSLEEAQNVSDHLVKEISKRCEAWIFPSFYPSLVDYVIDLLRQQGKKLATAESCTGGLLSSWIIQLPGASEVLECGFVVYSNASKIDLLGVDPEELHQHGAVSEPVTKSLLQGLLKKGLSAAVAITGIAGPDGGTLEKPVGTVCIGVAVDTYCYVQTVHLLGDRQQIQQRAAAAALVMLRSALKTDPK